MIPHQHVDATDPTASSHPHPLALPEDPPAPPLPASRLPEDVAVLYAWAGLPSARYHDFSPAHAERRAQRARVAAALPSSRRLPPPRTPADPYTDQQRPPSGLPLESSGYRPVFRPIPNAQSLAPIPSLPIQEAPSVPAWFYTTREHAVPSPSTSNLGNRQAKLGPLPSAPSGDPLLPTEDTAPACVILFSFAGGVGKTTLLAALGRALSAMEEPVLLADPAPHSLLPFFFGAAATPSATAHTVAPSAGRGGAPVSILNPPTNSELSNQADFLSKLLPDPTPWRRILLEASAASVWLLPALAPIHPIVLIPLASDMSSVFGLPHLEEHLAHLTLDAAAKIQPTFLLNRFDASLALHRDVRNILRDRLGHRLLPITIRNSPEIAEALANRTTVADHAPGALVLHDLRDLALWIRQSSPAPQKPAAAQRWIEQ